MKTIPVRQIQNIEGQLMRVPQRDADGEVVWRERCALCEQPEDGTVAELETLTTPAALRMLIFSVPAEIRKPADPEHAYNVMQAVRASNGDTIELSDDDYEFIVRLLDRPVPSNADQTTDDDSTNTMAIALWAMNSYAVRQQLISETAEAKVDAT